MKTLIVPFLFFLLPMGLFGHGIIHEKIEKITTEIEASTDVLHDWGKLAPLYFERGKLYFLQGNCPSALMDFIHAELHGYSDKELQYRLAEVYHKMETNHKALEYANEFISLDPDNPMGYRMRSSIYISLNRYNEVLQDFEVLFACKSKPNANDYKALADYILKQDSDGYKLALRYLQQGYERLGNSQFLEYKILEMKKLAKKFEETLYAYDKMIKKYKRKEVILYEKANYLFSLKKYDQSYRTLLESKEFFSQLTKRQQSSNAMGNLRFKIASLENKLQ